jgi:hypothetical protein
VAETQSPLGMGVTMIRSARAKASSPMLEVAKSRSLRKVASVETSSGRRLATAMTFARPCGGATLNV